jgi:hypothetical protein
MTKPAHRLTRHAFAVDRDDALADILGEVADPLQFVGDSQDANNLPQIDGHRLAPRDRLDGFFFDSTLDSSIVASASMTRWARPPSRVVSASMASAICLSASPPISANVRASSCRSESNALVVCSTKPSVGADPTLRAYESTRV